MKSLRALRVMLLIAAAVAAHSASAKGCMGRGETLHFVSGTDLLAPSGGKLLLFHKKTQVCFLFPYWTQSDGLVLATAPDARGYFPLPEAEELRELQDRGLLPRPLPEVGLNVFDWVFGYFMWGVVAVIVYMGIRIKRAERRAA